MAGGAGPLPHFHSPYNVLWAPSGQLGQRPVLVPAEDGGSKERHQTSQKGHIVLRALELGLMGAGPDGNAHSECPSTLNRAQPVTLGPRSVGFY